MTSEKVIIVIRIDLFQGDIGVFLLAPDFGSVSMLVNHGEKEIDFVLYRVLLLNRHDGDPAEHFLEFDKDEVVVLIHVSDLVQDRHHRKQKCLLDFSDRHNANKLLVLAKQLLGGFDGETSLILEFIEDYFEPFPVAEEEVI